MSDLPWVDIESMVEALRAVHNIPGVSVSVVRMAKDAHTRGFGRRDDSAGVRADDTDSCAGGVDGSTAFCIGSITKSFTAMLIAHIIQDKPDIKWDTPLRDIFGPSFKFRDQFRTEEVCLRDLMAHKLGIELGESDFGWMCEGMARKDILRNLQHLPISASFRTKMMYNNFMYAVVGLVAETLTDTPWESLIEDTFFQLLGMENATFIDREESSDSGLALPHLGHKGSLKPIPLDVHKCAGMVGPAATICCSANDMAKWMTFLLLKGCIGDVEIIKKSCFQECWKPQFALPQGKPGWDGYVTKPSFPVTESRDSYGLGFYLGSYRGFSYVAHAGELFGYDSLMTLYPDLGIGIYTATNGPGGQPASVANQLLHYYLSDICLNENPWLDIQSVATFPEPWKTKESIFAKQLQTSIDKSLHPSRQLSEYVGSYSHGFIGEISVGVQGTKLYLSYGRIGVFNLYPDGEEDEFRMEGCGALDFIHQVDMLSPSDWIMVKFVSDTPSHSMINGLICSLFESGPLFVRINAH